MLKEESERLRQELEASRDRSGRLRPSVELKASALAVAQKRLGGGETLRDVAAALGVQAQTLRKWMQPKMASFSAIELEARPPSGFTVHGPCGLWIEGLEMRELAELIAQLG